MGLGVAVDSRVVPSIVLPRKSGTRCCRWTNGRLRVTVDIYVRPLCAANSGASGHERIRTVLRPVGNTLDRRRGAWRNRGYALWGVLLVWIASEDGIAAEWKRSGRGEGWNKRRETSYGADKLREPKEGETCGPPTPRVPSDLKFETSPKGG